MTAKNGTGGIILQNSKMPVKRARSAVFDISGKMPESAFFDKTGKCRSTGTALSTGGIIVEKQENAEIGIILPL